MNYKTTAVTELRGKAAVDAFFAALQSPGVKVEEAMIAAASAPAPRFFVELTVAKRWVSVLARGKRLPFKQPNKIALYKELYRRWKARRVNHYLVLESIILEPAPCFYLDRETFRVLVYKTLRKNRKKKLKDDKV